MIQLYGEPNLWYDVIRSRTWASPSVSVPIRSPAIRRKNWNASYRLWRISRGESRAQKSDGITSQNTTRRNHYIPQFYLKNWSLDGKTIQTYISPKLLLFSEVGVKRKMSGLDYSPAYSKLFREMIIWHAHRYVYADRPQKGMLAFNACVVNRDIYEYEQQSITGWHIENVEAEQKLLGC